MTKILLRVFVLLTIAPMLASCSDSSPTIEEILEEDLQSVQGLWRGLGPATLTLQFRLTQEADNQVHGTGTMKETSEATPVPITVTGTFHRPTLALAFGGLVYEGRPVTGVFRGDYQDSEHRTRIPAGAENECSQHNPRSKGLPGTRRVFTAGLGTA